MNLFILASKSPRRQQIMQDLHLNFKVHPSDYAEDKTMPNPKDTALLHAIMKARDVARHYKASATPEKTIIVAVDTLVTYKDRIFGKPKDSIDAKDTLKFLNGSTHEVISGICLIDLNKNKEVSTAVSTKVSFEKMTHQEMDDYILSQEGEDKAAGYAIQGKGAYFVKGIDGDYFNVVGFPVNAFYKLLKKLDVDLLKQK